MSRHTSLPLGMALGLRAILVPLWSSFIFTSCSAFIYSACSCKRHQQQSLPGEWGTTLIQGVVAPGAVNPDQAGAVILYMLTWPLQRQLGTSLLSPVVRCTTLKAKLTQNLRRGLCRHSKPHSLAGERGAPLSNVCTSLESWMRRATIRLGSHLCVRGGVQTTRSTEPHTLTRHDKARQMQASTTFIEHDGVRDRADEMDKTGKHGA